VNTAFEIAMRVLGIDEDTARSNNKVVPEIGGFYFWQPGRGGASLLVSGEGETLAATSAVSFEKHLEAFLSGKRN